ncbi:alpha/beta fold hydrolase [Rhodococcus opacus]|uniref:alpha/beta fold hydrolase n=1 Tax=Rhodococcus opacus TaxID=37919 RepID=UPI001C461636|nr:alpha/beta fold hydrolase [Rhodococcus opacus]MBV6757731.1 alpha/beta hydrolase [Rhodococcus opacus]
MCVSLTQNSEPEIFGEPAAADATTLTVVGAGAPVVFLHGWGLTPQVYGRSLATLAQQGHRIVTPTLPGFGGTPDHAPEDRTFAGYAAWLGRFLDDAGISEPVTLVGHSFGGGVAIQAAHDLPERVARLVLVNSVGGGAWSSDGWHTRPIGERPLWDWGASMLGEALSIRSIAHTTASLVNGFLPNTVRDPGAVWRTAHLARRADLRRELGVLADRGLPVSLVWGRGDRMIPLASFESLRHALRNPPVHTVTGGHGWLIHDHAAFADAVRRALHRP